jgi:hypothetical protein
MTILQEARNATLSDLRDTLLDQHARKLDVVAPAKKLRFRDGKLILSGLDPVIEAAGVTDVNGTYRPTEVFDEGISTKLGIPLAYVRRLRNERPDLYDANANGWLRGANRLNSGTGQVETLAPPDKRSFLLRAFRGDEEGHVGVARALLSDRFSILDNLDALMASLDGVRQAGANVHVSGCDLTDRRMYVRIQAPEVKALAPELLRGYRSPFSGETGADNPTVFAGFVISNSETGDGSFSITPRLTVQVCSNGMTITKDAMKAIHLGGKMDEGIRWTKDTIDKQLALVTAKARDAVATFLDVDYMRKVIRDMETMAGKPIEDVEDVKVIAKKLAFDQETQDSIFNMFVKGGQITAGGVMQAVTAAAQRTKDADKASELEAASLRALELAFAL